jgi:hypothetical protein
MRKLPDSLRKESNEITNFDESGFELDLSEAGEFDSAPTETNNIMIEIFEDKQNSLEQKFDKFLIEAIDEALCSLGEPVKNAVYLHLQNAFGIEKKDIPGKVEEFSDIIHKIFGLGASRLEIKFMKNLNSKIEVDVKMPEHEWPLSKWIVADLSFEIYIFNVRKSYINQHETEHNANTPTELISTEQKLHT